MAETDNMALMERGATPQTPPPTGDPPWKKQDAENEAERYLAAACSWAVFLEVLLVVLFFAAAIAAAGVGISAFGSEDSGAWGYREPADDGANFSVVLFGVLIGAAVQMLIFIAAASTLRNFLYHKRNDREANRKDIKQ